MSRASGLRRALLLLALLPLLGRADGALPQGWSLVDPGGGFRATSLDESCGHPRGLLLASRGPTSGHATVAQRFLATPYLGQRLRLSATATTREVKDWAGIWMRVDGAFPQRSLAFDNLQDRPLTGTQACHPVQLVLDVPAQARSISAGLLLEGEGEVELSDLRFEPVSAEVPSTDLLRRGVPLRAPGRRVETSPADPAGAVARVEAGQPADFVRGIPPQSTAWFSAQQLRDRGLALDLGPDGRWADATGQSLAFAEGDAVRVDLEGLQGLVALRRDGPALLLEGTWDGRPIQVRVLPGLLEAAWGDRRWRFYPRRQRLWDDPGCAWYVEDRRRGHNGGYPDERAICGQLLDPAPPAVPAAVLLLRTVQAMGGEGPQEDLPLPAPRRRPGEITIPFDPSLGRAPGYLAGPNREPLLYYDQSSPQSQPVDRSHSRP